MGAHTKRTVAVVAAVVAAAAVGYVAINNGGADAQKTGAPTGVAVTTTDPVPAGASSGVPATTAADPAGATPSSAPTSAGAQSGVFAADGATSLSQFPSLVKFDQQLGGRGGKVVTTIDPRFQRAAAQAVAAHPLSAMVVLQASTGRILAMASNGPADLAYHAARAPGSTFKVVTAEALLRDGLTPDSPAPCPAKDPKFGITNDDSQTVDPSATLRWGFVHSCNTSFTGLFAKAADHPVSQEAATYFGLNQPWDLGLGATVYGTADGSSPNVPQATSQGYAAELFGQGDITVSPLNMAAVAATVAAGRFHQPILVTGTRPTATAQPLDGGVAANLRTLMLQAVTQGTASSLRGLSPAVGAKTGTAQAADGEDSWMIAYQGDVAVACLVEHGGFGNDAAGPEIAAVLRAVR